MGTDKVVYIRTDGNTDLATGHIMRCLTIAKALQRKQAKVVFLVADSESEKLLATRMENEEFSIINLHTNYRDTDEELPVLCQFIMSYPCDLLLIDSYFVTPGYLDTLSRMTQTAYIDDLYAFPYPVDTVINYDIAPDPNAECYSLAKQKLLGLFYTPLRDMFAQAEYNVSENLSNILFTAGGMNDGSLLTEAIQCILAFYETAKKDGGLDRLPTIHLLLGKDTEPCAEICALQERYPDRIMLHGYVSEMASFLCGFDLVLSAAGTTLYELCALGIPSISYVIADNQIPSAVAFADAGLVPCLGDLRMADVERMEFLTDLLTVLQPKEARSACSENMGQAMDKKGADRIADALL